MKTSAITLGRWDVPVIMLCYALHLGLWAALLPAQLWGWPLWLGLGAAALQAIWHFTLIRGRARGGCFKAFRLNHWLGLAVFAGVAAAHL